MMTILDQARTKLKMLEHQFGVKLKDEPVDFEEDAKDCWSSGQQRAYGRMTELQWIIDQLGDNRHA